MLLEEVAILTPIPLCKPLIPFGETVILRCRRDEPEPVHAIGCFREVMTSGNDPSKPFPISTAQLLGGAQAVVPGDPANDEICILLDAGASERARAPAEADDD